ncbi:MDR family MFS transporter [Sporolactobacillus vineae]|uniref:MDR family MFS transporter n=1 Tax=Sporolactobacillus vineae TaxID=444463 RepID=UPI000287B73F|nr:MDR family MFS transporter [Sporolactobacillus vineae]
MGETNKRTVMSGLMIGTFLTAIEGTVISTAMPKIIGDLQGIRIMDWMFSIFMLTSAVTVPLFGKLADVFGRKKVFVWGTSFFLIGSALCGLSWSMTALIVFRGLQGIGAGAVMTLSTTIIGDIYPVETRAKMFGLIGMIWGIAGIFGPLVGGFFVDSLSWHWIFFINIPFGLLSISLIVAGLKEEPSHQDKKLDLTGAGTFTVSMVALLFGLQKAGENGSWSDPSLLILLVVFILFFTAFLISERKAADPLIPFSVLKKPMVVLNNCLALAAAAILIGNDIYLPMWLQGVLGYNATASGFVLTPMSLTWMAGSFLCGRLLARRGVRITGLIGTGFLLAGTFWMVLLDPSSSRSWMYLMTAILGLGFGIALTLTTICVQSSVSFRMRGAATASNQFFRSIGQTIGAAAFGTYFNARAAEKIVQYPSQPGLDLHLLNQLVRPAGGRGLPEHLAGILRHVLAFGIHHVFLVLLVLAGVTAVCALMLPGQIRAEADQKV